MVAINYIHLTIIVLFLPEILLFGWIHQIAHQLLRLTQLKYIL